MSLSYEQRKTDPRWIEAGRLFDAKVDLVPAWSRFFKVTANPHALANIKYAVQEATLGVPDSGYEDPDATLEQTVSKYVRLDGPGRGLLEECQQIARSAARTAEVAVPAYRPGTPPHADQGRI